jgi:hypothetical protein
MTSSKTFRLFSVVIILTTCSLLAPAQASSGSIVVFALQQDKFSLAADSQTTDQHGSKRYEQCKILALDHSILFAAAGFLDYMPVGGNNKTPSWSAFEIARQVVKAAPNGDLRSIADAWADQMKTQLEALGPRRVGDLSLSHNDNIANGVFASAKEGRISVATRSLKLESGTFKIESGEDLSDGDLGAVGEIAVYSELVGPPPPRTLTKDDPDWPHDISPKKDATDRVKLVASLTAKWDASGYVGGPIDVVELWSDGTIHWISQKPQCMSAQ